MAANKKKARRHPGKRRKKTRLGNFLGFLRSFSIFVIAPVFLGAAIGGFMAFARGVPSIAELRQDITPPSTRIFADDDMLIGEFKVQKGRYFSLKKMPRPYLCRRGRRGRPFLDSQRRGLPGHRPGRPQGYLEP
jgi:membrane peptidoglycan carboxypeptidase